MWSVIKECEPIQCHTRQAKAGHRRWGWWGNHFLRRIMKILHQGQAVDIFSHINFCGQSVTRLCVTTCRSLFRGNGLILKARVLLLFPVNQDLQLLLEKADWDEDSLPCWQTREASVAAGQADSPCQSGLEPAASILPGEILTVRLLWSVTVFPTAAQCKTYFYFHLEHWLIRCIIRFLTSGRESESICTFTGSTPSYVHSHFSLLQKIKSTYCNSCSQCLFSVAQIHQTNP